MLARRFTIVCLLVTIFGMGLSILVADRSLTAPSRGGAVFACDFSNPMTCTLPRH